MSDAVKAALDAARMGICRTLDINPGEPPCEAPCLLCREGSAAAIAEFLRALPPEFNALVRFDSGNVDPVFFAEDWELLAAAVTRAAQEGKR
jgi:hypothetical protein